MRCGLLTAAVTALAAATSTTRQPLLLVPLALTCVLGLALPASPLARPRSIIGGYTLALLTAAAVLAVPMPPDLALGVTAGLSLLTATALRVVHPPASALAILLVQATAPLNSMVPAFAGVLLTSTALALINALLPPSTSKPPP